MSIELFQQGPAERRFAGSNLAGKLHKAFALANTVEEMIEGFAMFRAVEQEARIRRDVERRDLQSIELKIHAGLFSRIPD